MGSAQSSQPTVGFWDEARIDAPAVVTTLMRDIEDAGDDFESWSPEIDDEIVQAAELALVELETLFGGICERLRSFASDGRELDLRRRSVLSVMHSRQAMEVRIGEYRSDPRTLTLQITRRASLDSVWAALKVPAILTQGWWVMAFSLERPSNWPYMEVPREDNSWV